MQQDPTIPQNPENPTTPPVTIGGAYEKLPQTQPAAQTNYSSSPPTTQPVAEQQKTQSQAPQNPPVANTHNSQNPIHPQSPVANNVRSRGGDGWKSALSTILILIAAPLLAILLTTFVFQSYEVDGESMETTLQNNDRLIVWKMPVTISKLTSGDYVPERGEVVVFHRYGTATATGGGDKQLIKRVIGLPGERVVVRDNQITIYNTEHPEGFNPDSSEYGERAQISPGNVDLTVPDGEVFVVGDNRNNSLDSRAFGTISVDDIVGELGARIFPFDKAQVY